jgi:hypothetical protein
VLFTFIGVGMAVLVGFLADLLQKRTAKAAPQTPKATTLSTENYAEPARAA